MPRFLAGFRFCFRSGYRSVAAVLAVAAGGLLAPIAAQAQYDRPIGQPLGQNPLGQIFGGAPAGNYGYASGQGVVCESQGGDFTECRTPFNGPPAIARTLSSAACVQGQTWGSRYAGSVWVSGGCRAEFADAYAGQGGYDQGGYGQDGYGQGGYGPADANSVRCESQDGRRRECRANVQSRLTLQRQLSDAACVEGQTWGSDRNGRVWVQGGCRGDFAPVAGWGQGGAVGGGGGSYGYGYGNGAAVRCESDDGRYRECRANVAGRLTLLRQLSDAACVEGQSWGSDRNGRVWVRHGCRGEFGPAQGGGWGQPGYGYGQGITCESAERRYNACAWDPRWGRPYVTEQLSSDACQEGRQWGYDGRGQIWVDRGCRARFSGR